MIHCGAHGEHLSRYSICMRLLQLEGEANFPGIQLRDRMATVDIEKRGKHSCLPVELQSPTFTFNRFRLYKIQVFYYSISLAVPNDRFSLLSF